MDDDLRAVLRCTTLLSIASTLVAGACGDDVSDFLPLLP